MSEQTTENPWWFPVITDAAWCERIRSDYSENTDGMDDDDIRDEYADGRKYADLWDHTGDAREQFEKLADAYLELLDKWNRRAAPVVTKEMEDRYIDAVYKIGQGEHFRESVRVGLTAAPDLDDAN